MFYEQVGYIPASVPIRKALFCCGFHFGIQATDASQIQNMTRINFLVSKLKVDSYPSAVDENRFQLP